MKKRILPLLLCLLICLCAALPAVAAEADAATTHAYVTDSENILNADELTALNEQAAVIEKAHDFFVGLAIVGDPGDSLTDYLQSAYAEMTTLENGILLGYSQQKQMKVVERFGTAKSIFSSVEEDALLARFGAADSWAQGAQAYLEGARKQLEQYTVDGTSYLAQSLESGRLSDGADLLTDTEEINLLTRLNVISERQKCDIVVVTVDSTGGKSAMDYADDYYDYNEAGFSEDGVALLISMEDQYLHISTKGFGMQALTDEGIEYIGDQVAEYMHEGEEDYPQAFATFARLCDEFWDKAQTGDPYDSHNMDGLPGYEGKRVSLLTWIGIALIAGLLVAVIGTGTMKSKLKSVRWQPAASNYLKPGSLNVTQARETFLYTHVSRVAKPQSSSGGGSSTHTSSSGSTHGGGGRHF